MSFVAIRFDHVEKISACIVVSEKKKKNEEVKLSRRLFSRTVG